MKTRIVVNTNLVVVLFLSFLFSTYAFSQSLTDSLKAWYTFDGNAFDMTGNGYNGSVSNATLTADRFGNANAAYMFNGTSSFIALPDDFDYPQRSFVVWFNASLISINGETIYDSDHSSLLYGKTAASSVQASGVKYLCLFQGSPDVKIQINENSWYMATITVGDSARFYLCDSLILTRPVSNVHSGTGYNYAVIGKSRLNDRFFYGKIDDIRIYNRALTPEEIHTLCFMYVGIEKNDADNEVLVYPNPIVNKSVLEFSNPGNEIHRLMIYDQLGRLVRTIPDITSDRVIIAKEDLPCGLYFFRLINERQMYSGGKFVME